MKLLSSYLKFLSNSNQLLSEQEEQLARKLAKYIMLMADDALLLISKKRAVIKQYGQNSELVKKISDEIEDKKKKIEKAKQKLKLLKVKK